MSQLVRIRHLLLHRHSPVARHLGIDLLDKNEELDDYHLRQFVRTHMGHAHQHGETVLELRGKAGERIARTGLVADGCLAVVKGFAGYISGSTALVADAAHSVSDIVLSAVAVWSLRAGRVPRDKEHPYGHGKFETLGALGISGMLVLTGCGIAWHAVEVLQALVPTESMLDVNSMHHDGHADGHDHAHDLGLFGHQHGFDRQHMGLALAAAVTSIGVKEGLYWATLKVGQDQGSQLLKANAWHHRTDAISSVVALVGVGGAAAGLPWLDPVAALCVSGMILKAGVETGYQSAQELVDKGVSESVLSPIRSTVLRVQGVEDCHDLRGRRAGSYLYIDAHIEVDPWLSVSAAHNIGEAVRHLIHDAHPEVAESYVHIDPAKRLNEDVGFNDTNSTDSNETNSSRLQPDIERDIREVFAASKYAEVVSLRQVTCHFLKGKVVAEVEITLDQDLRIRDAMQRAKDMECDIISTIPDVSSVKMQLRLKN